MKKISIILIFLLCIGSFARPKQADAISPILVAMGISLAVHAAGLMLDWLTDSGEPTNLTSKSGLATPEQASGAGKPPEVKTDFKYGCSGCTNYYTGDFSGALSYVQNVLRTQGNKCSDAYYEQSELPNPLPTSGSGVIAVKFYTNKWPCTTPGATGFLQYSSPSIGYSTPTTPRCPTGLSVQSNGTCGDSSMADGIPGFGGGSDGTIVELDPDGMGLNANRSEDGSNIQLPSVLNPDLAIPGKATLQKTGDEKKNLKVDEKYPTLVHKEDGTTGEAEINLSMEVAPDGSVLSSSETVTYMDGSTPQPGDRLTDSSWIGPDGSIVLMDPVPGGLNDTTGGTGSGGGDGTGGTGGTGGTDGTGGTGDLSGLQSTLDGIKNGQCGGVGQPECKVDLGDVSGVSVLDKRSSVNSDALNPDGQVTKQDELKAEIDELKEELKVGFERLVNLNLSGSEYLPSWSFSTLGSTFTIDLARYAELLSPIADLILFFTSVTCLFIIIGD